MIAPLIGYVNQICAPPLQVGHAVVAKRSPTEAFVAELSFVQTLVNGSFGCQG